MITVFDVGVGGGKVGKLPSELATATSSAAVVNAPEATTPLARAWRQMTPTPLARCSGVQPAVRSPNAVTCGIGSGPGQRHESRGSPAGSGRWPARAPATSRSAWSLRSLVAATPILLPSTTRTRTSASLSATFWWMIRVGEAGQAESLDQRPPPRSGRRWSAPGSCLAICLMRACPNMCILSSLLHHADADVAEAGRRCAVADVRHLAAAGPCRSWACPTRSSGRCCRWRRSCPRTAG